MATALGQRYLDRYVAGTATIEQLQSCLTKAWITQDEYDTATAPPATV